jgi:type VI secretion system secreted protein VgrG
MPNIFLGRNAESRFAFKSHAPDAPEFDVVKFEGREAISSLFWFDLTLVARTADVDLSALTHHAATFAMRTATGLQYTPYHGIVSQAQQLGQVDRDYFYRVVVVPKLHTLTLSCINEIYLSEDSIPDVISNLLRNNNFSNSDFKVALKNPSDYRKHSFVCQYQETHFAFISRWMEKEGLYYYFDHEPDPSILALARLDGNDSAQLVMTDYKQSHSNNTLSLKYIPPENVQTARLDQSITSFIWQRQQVSKKVIVQDYNFRKAAIADDLKADETVSDGRTGEIMFFGDNLRTKSEASRLAKVRAEQLDCEAEKFFGEAPAIGIRSGYFIEVSNHYRNDCNDRYLVTEIEHRGSQIGVVLSGKNTQYTKGETGSIYHAKFQAIRASQQFRAKPVTPRPSIAGFLSGIVDSEGLGQSAELNEYGQYKVQMLYDLSDKRASKGSAWIRMASPYAGDGHGMHFPLLKGTEVVVGFNGGDPDQPIILGAVTNSENKNVVVDSNAQQNGMKSVAGNIISMNDSIGNTNIVLHSPQGNSYMILGQFPSLVSSPPNSPKMPDLEALSGMASIMGL